ncbi:MAG TPA: polyribonucleotide nucleotidyltransferase [Candidatus Omnitrophota bacterium]|nr:polyribonucleotide nucleotidyltransferase [Candidatus Omnitrophota bacterium]HPT06718.1 polyribonucleotide nucleotidyltransferase [Candidatus Omnitrophota bacterium]
MNTRFGRNDIVVETGKVAKQANGSVTVQYGGTVVLVTACMSKEPKVGQGFFPLMVDYQEKTYAAGRIPGGFFKREGRPSESEILTARLIDRPIRPLFPNGFLNDVQIVALVLSSDGENDPDIMAVNGAAFALAISDIPFSGPVACCRVGRVDGKFILNPTYAELDAADLDVVLVVNRKGVMMLEAKSKEVSEDIFQEALKFGYENVQVILDAQDDFAQQFGKPKAGVPMKTVPPELFAKVQELALDRLNEVFKLTKKDDREEAVDILAREIKEKLVSEGYEEADIKNALYEVEKKCVRERILNANVRVDGRGFKEVRTITCEVPFLPRTHGSSLFTRGQTQSMAVTTLGSGDDEQMVEALEGEKTKTFMLHYNFPPFSVGETGPMRGAGRREIGHGALAEKALLAVMPKKEEFPYTVRVVSEILESNGSSSMATVCSATLSLMDAGVPIKAPVAGMAMGLIKEGDKALILTDIAGIEDHLGDMDFKVAGTAKGITAVQVDLKIDGIDLDLCRKIVEQAKEGRIFVLGKMHEAIAGPRAELSSYAPRIEVIKINPEKIGGLIGPGGKTIKKIIAQTGASIDIQDDGTVFVSSIEAFRSQDAIRMIRALTDEVEVGRIYPGKVTRLMKFGAFVEIAPGKEGLVHVSELSKTYVKEVESIVKVGDTFNVKVVGVDELGRVNLSKKQAEDDSAPAK